MAKKPIFKTDFAKTSGPPIRKLYSTTYEGGPQRSNTYGPTKRICFENITRTAWTHGT